MSRPARSRHRRRGPFARAVPGVVTTAGSVALVTTVGTAAFWLVPAELREPFHGAERTHSGSTPPTTGLIPPTMRLTSTGPESERGGDRVEAGAGGSAGGSAATGGAAGPGGGGATGPGAGGAAAGSDPDGDPEAKPQARGSTRTPRPKRTTSPPPSDDDPEPGRTLPTALFPPSIPPLLTATSSLP